MILPTIKEILEKQSLDFIRGVRYAVGPLHFFIKREDLRQDLIDTLEAVWEEKTKNWTCEDAEKKGVTLVEFGRSYYK